MPGSAVQVHALNLKVRARLDPPLIKIFNPEWRPFGTSLNTANMPEERYGRQCPGDLHKRLNVLRNQGDGFVIRLGVSFRDVEIAVPGVDITLGQLDQLPRADADIGRQPLDAQINAGIRAYPADFLDDPDLRFLVY